MREPRVLFKFHRPSGEQVNPPSLPMVEALRQISLSDEMLPLLSRARADGRDIMIEVFHGGDGQPLLIHTAMYPSFTS